MRWWLTGAALSAAIACAGVAMVVTSTSSCSQTPTNNPLRTFERAQKIDVVCMQVFSPDPNNPGGNIPIPPVPARQEQCSPIPPFADPSTMLFHLYALVTQTSHGELAVVDLIAGIIVDEDRSTPGVNFLPVGALPTDVAVTPDGQMTFVAAAEVNKPAIYAIPNARILGDSQVLSQSLYPPPATLTSWPVCALPQAPGPISVVPAPPSLLGDGGAAEAGEDAGGSDAGAADGGADGGAEGGTAPGAPYVLAVVLPGDGTNSAKVVTIDPTPLMRGAGIQVGDGPVIPPASLTPCPILSAVELSAYVPTRGGPGPNWEDGVRYVDGGIDLADAVVPAVSTVACADGGITAMDAGDAEAGTGGGSGTMTSSLLPTVGLRCASGEGGIADAGSDVGLAAIPPPPPHASAAARRDQILYVSDDALPIIHVIDVSAPGALQELAPLAATSTSDPVRQVAVGGLAVSPPTREYKRYLYAIDKKDSPASIMVYDVTDPNASPHVPLTRPHPELNPFSPIDRISFSAPVAAVSFAQHDFALSWNKQGGTSGPAPTGLVCNPNPNAGLDQGPFLDLGAAYRANVNNQPVLLGPTRLRGVFAFATLSTGGVVTIDVDDWDAPCRRPDPMANDAGSPLPPSDIAPVEPDASSPMDLDPYHAPNAFVNNPNAINNGDPTTQEAYFPVSAPHRPRSFYYLRNDPTTGIHIPNIAATPELFSNNAALPVTGSGSAPNGIMLPTHTDIADPYGSTIAGYDSAPGVRFAWEDPFVQNAQAWQVVYEGALPTYANAAALITTTDNFQTLTLSVPNGLLCRGGVEDFDVGADRVKAMLVALASRPSRSAACPALPQGIETYTVDYVQALNSIVDPSDPYWAEPNDCWDPAMTDPGGRFNACAMQFGAGVDAGTPILSDQRDFPILQAYDDHFVIGRFGYPDGVARQDTRTAAPISVQENDASNPAFLKALKCCFNNKMTFNVRTGGEWVTTGSSFPYLHHMIRDPSSGRCVQSCDQDLSLLNSRTVGLVPPADPTFFDPAQNALNAVNLAAITPDRNSALAMRNPLFSFVVWNGISSNPGPADAGPSILYPRPVPDTQWQFSTQGQFTLYSVSIASGSTAVSPQSMLFIPALGQLAVVDGSLQGLVLIDLNTIALAHAPYL